MKLELENLPETWNDIPIIDEFFQKAVECGFTELKPFCDDDFLKKLCRELKLSLTLAKEEDLVNIPCSIICYQTKKLLRKWFEEGKLKRPKINMDGEEGNPFGCTLDVLSVGLWKLVLRRVVGGEYIGKWGL